MKLNNLWVLALICICIYLPFVSSAEWIQGNLHQHTGYSTQLGNDWYNPFDDCTPYVLLEGHWSGYTVEELANQAQDINLDYLALSDHSYCIDNDEFNDVRDRCATVDSDEDHYAGFSCLNGEELSTQDATGDNENILEAALLCANPNTGEAHMGGYGINSLVGQTPISRHCPTTPTAQQGINVINSQGGVSILNHPRPLGGFLDFQSISSMQDYKGIEIWNEDWSSDDQDSLNLWINFLRQGKKVYAFGGSDDHENVTATGLKNNNFVRVDSLTSSGLKNGISSGGAIVSNNGYVIIEAKRSTDSTWTQIGRELTASQNDILDMRVSYNLDSTCTIKVRSAKIGNAESTYFVGVLSGVGQTTIHYPLSTTGDFYYRAECGDAGSRRIYTNPIWVNVGSGGSCTEWQGSTCNVNSCATDEIYQTRTCNGATQSRCVYSPTCPGAGATQCTPSSCSSGYSSPSPTCSMVGDHYTCDRTCYRPGSCGSYGGWNIRSSAYGVDQSDNGFSFFSPSQSTSTSSCYQFYSNSELSISNWDPGGVFHFDAESVRVYSDFEPVSGYSSSQCSGGQISPVSSSTSTYFLGRGTGSSYYSESWFNPYQSFGCVDNAYGLTGTLYSDLYYRTATWTPEDTYHNYCDVPDAYSVTLSNPIYANVNAQCDVDVDTAESYPSQIDVKWYVNGNFVDGDNCDGSGGDQCDDTSGRGWGNIFELDQSYYSAGDEVYCTARGRGDEGGNGAYRQSATRTVTNRVPTWSSISLNKVYAQQSESITATANSEDDLDSDTLGLYCCNGASCTPSTSNFDFCFASGDSSPYDLSCIGEGASGDGSKTVRCVLYDGLGYSSILSQTYTADNSAPVISNAQANATSVSTNAYVRLNCTATDAGSGINTVWVEADKPTSANQNYTMSILSGSTYYKDLQLTEEGLWSFNCWANDTVNRVSNRTIGTVNALAYVSPQLSFTSFTLSDGSSQNSSSFSAGLNSTYNGTYYDFVDLDKTLTLWVRGDDKNASGSFIDVSGYNNTVTTLGSPQNVSGAFGSALSLVNSPSSGLRVANSASLNVTEAFTISLWMKGSDTRYNQFLAGKWDGVTANTISWQLSLASGGICNGLDLYVSQDGGSVNRAYTRKCNQNYQDGQWHHVAGVFIPGQELSLYIDGSLSGSTTIGNIATLTGAYPNTQSFYIGNRTSGTYNGSIDEVLFFKRALTQQEINSLYNAQANQYTNTFISLSAGAHTIQGFAVNSSGNRTNTETRTISVTAPYSTLQFIAQTPLSGSIVNVSQFAANLSSSDSGVHYSATDFDRDIVLWMPFDDVNATGSPMDISTYASHGSKQGNANQSASGKFGKSFSFDGVGDSVDIADRSSLDLNSSFSVSFWFKGNASTAQQPFVGKWNGTSGQIAWFADLATGGACDGIDFYVSEDGGSTDRVYVRECNKRYQDNQWHHFVGTFSPGISISMYIDGASVGSVQGTVSSVNGVYTNNLPIQIGAGYTTAQYNGSVDDVLLFRRALSQSEVSALHNAGSNQYRNTFTQVDDITHAIRGYAMNSYGVRNKTELRTFKILLPLDVYSLTYSSVNNTKAISFWINNTLSTNITNIAWNVSTGLTNKYSNFSKNITLKGGEAALVFIVYNYTTPGTYPLTATAYNANYKDVEVISVTV